MSSQFSPFLWEDVCPVAHYRHAVVYDSRICRYCNGVNPDYELPSTAAVDSLSTERQQQRALAAVAAVNDRAAAQTHAPRVSQAPAQLSRAQSFPTNAAAAISPRRSRSLIKTRPHHGDVALTHRDTPEATSSYSLTFKVDVYEQEIKKIDDDGTPVEFYSNKLLASRLWSFSPEEYPSGSDFAWWIIQSTAKKYSAISSPDRVVDYFDHYLIMEFSKKGRVPCGIKNEHVLKGRISDIVKGLAPMTRPTGMLGSWYYVKVVLLLLVRPEGPDCDLPPWSPPPQSEVSDQHDDEDDDDTTEILPVCANEAAPPVASIVDLVSEGGAELAQQQGQAVDIDFEGWTNADVEASPVSSPSMSVCRAALQRRRAPSPLESAVDKRSKVIDKASGSSAALPKLHHFATRSNVRGAGTGRDMRLRNELRPTAKARQQTERV